MVCTLRPGFILSFGLGCGRLLRLGRLCERESGDHATLRWFCWHGLSCALVKLTSEPWPSSHVCPPPTSSA